MYMYNLPYMDSHKHVSTHAHISYTNAREEKETQLVFMVLTPPCAEDPKVAIPFLGLLGYPPRGCHAFKAKVSSFLSCQ